MQARENYKLIKHVQLLTLHVVKEEILAYRPLAVNVFLKKDFGLIYASSRYRKMKSKQYENKNS